MHLILVLVLVTAAGWWLGSRPVVAPRALKLGRPLMLGAIAVLLFTMGMSLGARPEIVSRLGAFGLRALSLSLAGSVGAVLAVGLFRRLYRIGRRRSGSPSTKPSPRVGVPL